jgi:hypothetical protein
VPDGHEELRMADLADDGCCGGPGLAEGAIWTSWMWC